MSSGMPVMLKLGAARLARGRGNAPSRKHGGAAAPRLHKLESFLLAPDHPTRYKPRAHDHLLAPSSRLGLFLFRQWLQRYRSDPVLRFREKPMTLDYVTIERRGSIAIVRF